MQYTIKTFKQPVSWDRITPLEVGNYPWGKDYTPTTLAWLYRVEGQGFCLKMQCEESQPKAIYHRDNEPVYKDSCMECFMSFFPHQDEKAYINFEMNANGALLCEYGIPGNRQYLKDKGIDVPKPVAKTSESGWEVELFIPDSFIEAVYGTACFESGAVLKGNFYKCGDETHTAHYGCWNFIENECPAFHKPEYFGELIVE